MPRDESSAPGARWRLRHLSGSSLPTSVAENLITRVQSSNASPFLSAGGDPSLPRSVSLHEPSAAIALQSTRSIPEGGDRARELSPIRSEKSWKGGRVRFLDLTEDRDGLVDKKATVLRWPRRLYGRSNVEKKRESDVRSAAWDISGAAKILVQSKTEEAKIIAWENLQKARAETEIRKLEMKLEKKRSSSMEKIMNKLKSAQKRAQEKRTSLASRDTMEDRKTASFSGCLVCRAF